MAQGGRGEDGGRCAGLSLGGLRADEKVEGSGIEVGGGDGEASGSAAGATCAKKTSAEVSEGASAASLPTTLRGMVKVARQEGLRLGRNQYRTSEAVWGAILEQRGAAAASLPKTYRKWP